MQTVPMQATTARDFMTKRLVTLRPEMDVLEAIDLLLRRQISGAPVVSAEGEFLGVFSEKCSMQVLLDAAYEQLPSNRVGAFMDRDAITIRDDTQLLSIAQAFLLSNRRRLPVLDEEGRLVGQVSRRDVLRQAMRELTNQPAHKSTLLYLSALVAREESPVA